jgi:hypothetical protein
LTAIQGALTPMLGVEWYEAREESAAEARAKYSLDLVKLGGRQNLFPQNGHGKS